MNLHLNVRATVKLGVALLSCLSGLAFAQLVPDLDTAFGSQGTATAAFDVGGSQFTDRGIAVFPGPSGGYVLVGAADSAVAGQERIGFAFYNANGAATGSAVPNIEVKQVQAACQIPAGSGGGFVVASRNLSNHLVVHAFTSAGAFDMTRFAGTGLFTLDAAGFEFVKNMSCHVNRFNFALGYAPSDSPSEVDQFSTESINYSDGSSNGGHFFPGAGGSSYKPILLGSRTTGQTYAVAAYSDNAHPNAILIHDYVDTALSSSNLGPQIIDIPLASCGAMSSASTATVETATLLSESIYIGGSAQQTAVPTSPSFEFFMQLLLASNGAASVVSCGSRRFGGVGVTSRSGFQQNHLVARNSDEFYWVGAYQASSFGSGDSDPSVWTIRRSGSSWNVGENILPINYASAPTYTDEPDEEAVFGLVDSRSIPDVLMVVGARVWQGADTDATLTKLRIAPLFANGFD